MLSRARLDIALIQAEGAADLVFHDVRDALDSLIHHQRLIASLPN